MNDERFLELLQASLLGDLAPDEESALDAELKRRGDAGERARRELALVVPSEAPRPNTLAHTVQRCRDAALFSPIEGARELAAVDLLSSAMVDAAPALESPLTVPRRPEHSEITELSIGATALADYSLCARRFELVHVLGFDEPSPLGLTAVGPA